MSTGTTSVPIVIEDPLIREFLNYLQHKKHYSPCTAKCYATDLQQFQEFRLGDAVEQAEIPDTSDGFDMDASSGGTGLAVLTSQSAVASTVRDASSESLVNTTTEDVRRFLAFLRDRGCTQGTAARKLATLRTFFKFCLSCSYVRFSPPALVQSPRREKHPPRSLNEDEFPRLLQATDASTFLGARDQAMLEAMYSTGIRASELVKLSIRDFDPVAQTLRIGGKAGNQRIVSLPGTVLAHLQRYLDMRGIHPQPGSFDARVLFVNKAGRKISTRNIRRRLDKYLAAAGLDPAISPHTLRQSFATRLLDNGADPRSVQKRMGHLCISSTLAYAHQPDGQPKEAQNPMHIVSRDAEASTLISPTTQ